MIWLIGSISFIVGLCVGAVLFKQFMSDAVKITNLEEKLSNLQSEYDHYKNDVNSHFSGTAQLIEKLTDSYREVYRHLATGASSLCSTSISEQLALSAKDQELLTGNGFQQSPNYNNIPTLDDSSETPVPPRDYADKTNPEQAGILSEEFGLKPDSDLDKNTDIDNDRDNAISEDIERQDTPSPTKHPSDTQG